jgi:hypothetical protein
MSTCPQGQAWIEKLTAGEISPPEVAAWQRHAQTCAECAALLELHEELAEWRAATPEPEAEALDRMRRRTLRAAVLAAPSPPVAGIARWLGALRLRPAVAIGFGVALLLGVLLGRQWPDAARPIDDGQLLRALREQAHGAGGVAGFWDAPFFYANVSARPVGEADLALSFDVCRHIEVVTPRSSPLANDVLLQAILEPDPVGGRLKAMEFAQGSTGGRLREAIIFTLHRDPNLAVRLKALEILMQSPYDGEVEAALLATLREDRAVQVRLQALEGLAAGQADPARLRQVLAASQLAGTDAVEIRAAELFGEPL